MFCQPLDTVCLVESSEGTIMALVQPPVSESFLFNLISVLRNLIFIQNICQDHQQEHQSRWSTMSGGGTNLITGMLERPAFCWTTSSVAWALVSNEVNAIVGLIIIICRWIVGDYDNYHHHESWRWWMHFEQIGPEARCKKCLACSFCLSLTKFWEAHIHPTTEPAQNLISQKRWRLQCIRYMWRNVYVIGWLWVQSEVAKGQQHLLTREACPRIWWTVWNKLMWKPRTCCHCSTGSPRASAGSPYAPNPFHPP